MTEVADVGRQLIKTTNAQGKWSTISMTTSTVNAEHSEILKISQKTGFIRLFVIQIRTLSQEIETKPLV